MTEAWIQVLSIVASNVLLFLWARTESRADYRECRQLLDAIHSEMKDFHGRLERQDAEFKAHLMHHHKEKG